MSVEYSQTERNEINKNEKKKVSTYIVLCVSSDFIRAPGFDISLFCVCYYLQDLLQDAYDVVQRDMDAASLNRFYTFIAK